MMRSAVSHNSGGRQTAGTDSVEGSDRAKETGEKEFGGRMSSIHIMIKQVPSFGPKVSAFFPGGSQIYRTVLRLIEARFAATCKDRKQMCSLSCAGDLN